MNTRNFLVVASLVVMDFATTGCGADDADLSAVRVVESPLFSDLDVFYDPPTVGGGPTVCSSGGLQMHCCPPGSAMTGANIRTNQFACRTLAAPTNIKDVYLSTERVGPTGQTILGCSQQAVIKGLHVGQSKVMCQRVPFFLATQYIDGSTTDGVMHVCPVPYAIRGIDVNNNKFFCSTDATQ
jgi:hypothetical protein